jgi:protein O-mannosyl-transferase
LHGDSIGYTIHKAFTSYVMGNYHPLTMLSYSVEYSLFKLNPKPYHIVNLVIHLLNTLLVMYFIWLLCKQKWVAFITALLFAIHPMHVESVAWVSERKDVLYTFFFLMASCTYIMYLQRKNKRRMYYITTLILFVLSILSKGMAVFLPIAFFAIDYFLERKFDKKIIIEKIPFLIIAFVFGLVSIQAQKSLEAVLPIELYKPFDRILFSSYAVVMYFVKFIAPFNLSHYYNYPLHYEGWYPLVYYVMPFVVAAIFILIYMSRKLGKEYWFGFGFFFITIASVLQILPVGGAIIADRYTYVPYIGISFIVARLLNGFIENSVSDKLKSYRNTVLIFFSGFIIMLCFLTHKRSKIWKDSITLISDAIEKSDIDPLMFMGRSQAYYLAGMYEKTIEDCNRFFNLNHLYPDVLIDPSMYYNRGMAYHKLNRFDEAIRDFSTIVKLDSTHSDAYYMRANAYYKTGNNQLAIADFTKAIQLKDGVADYYNDRGLIFFDLQQYDKAIEDYNHTLRIHPQHAFAYLNRGMAYYMMGRVEEAINDYNLSIQYNENFPNSYVNRGIALHVVKKHDLALADFTKAIALDSTLAVAYLNRGITYAGLANYENAINDFSQALKYEPSMIIAYYQRIQAYKALGRYDLAMNDIYQCQQFGVQVPQSLINEIQAKLKY